MTMAIGPEVASKGIYDFSGRICPGVLCDGLSDSRSGQMPAHVSQNNLLRVSRE